MAPALYYLELWTAHAYLATLTLNNDKGKNTCRKLIHLFYHFPFSKYLYNIIYVPKKLLLELKYIKAFIYIYMDLQFEWKKKEDRKVTHCYATKICFMNKEKLMEIYGETDEYNNIEELQNITLKTGQIFLWAKRN